MSCARRSYLFVPGDNETLLGKVLGAGADAVVLDLEDAVRPGRKEDARRLVAAFLAQNAGVDTPIYVRINALNTGVWHDDLATAVRGGVHGVRVAKAESAAQIEAVHQAMEVLEATAEVEIGKTRIVPTIENATGVLAAAEIAKAPRVEALCFGMVDFLADIHAHADAGLTASLHALSQLVLASRAASIAPPIGSAHSKLEDDKGLRATSELYRTLGFFGRSVIHPKQLATVHAVFTPSAEELERAKAIVRAFDASEVAGTVVVGEEFVDEAVVKHARNLLALAASLPSERGDRWP